jgi:hypothetical protein
MSAHAIAGLVALNLVLLAVGSAGLYALRGFRSWNEVLRLGGVAYMLGVATTGIVFVFELVIGLSLSLPAILVTEAVLAAAGVVAGYALRRPLPGTRLTFRRISLPGAAFAGLLIVYSEALFRSGRLAGLYEFDGWAFWVPKAKAIYFFGGLDHQFFAELPGPSYPPLVPAFEAASFHFMGSPDVVTLHLQFWFFLIGFVAAVAGLLSGRVPALLLWPPILLLLATPHVLRYALQAEGDFVLDELLALGALLVGLWLVEQRGWQLVTAAVVLGAAMCTKREGYLLAACIVLAALVASSRRVRVAWPRLLLAAAVALALTIPWRVLLAVRDLPRGGAEAGGTGLFDHLDRGWPSLRLALSTLFDFDIWLVVAPLALAAIAVAILAERGQLSVYALALFVLAIAAFTWTTWAFPSLPITKQAALNPIPRLTGSLAFVATAVVPMLLGVAWLNRGGQVRDE